MAKAKPTRGRAAEATVPEAAATKGMMKLRVKVDEPVSPRHHEARAQGVLPSDRLSLGRMVETNGGSCLEKVPGFDSARARTHGLLTPGAMPGSTSRRAAGADGFAMENDGGRAATPVAVGDTTALPWRSIALLTISYEDGTNATGTAWFLGERALGTAGHNIRHPVHGVATDIIVAPGYDGRFFHFGTYPVEETHCDPAWMNGNADPALDFGVLVLGEAVAGRRLGWFGFAAYGDKQLDKLLLNVSGYRTDRRIETQYFSGGRLLRTDPSFLDYSFNTSAGMSGAPVFALFDQQRVAVGIHTSAVDRTNRARRIDARLYDFLTPFTAL